MAAITPEQKAINRLAGQALDRMDSVLDYDRGMDRDAEKDAEAVLLGLLICAAVVIVGAVLSIWLLVRR